MAMSNFERMLQLAETVFDSKSDPGQLDVNENVIKRLQLIHSATLSEYVDGNGPVVWILLIPTTDSLMRQFLQNEISEKELYDLTPLNIQYEVIYLCSAMVLEEFRGKGIAKDLTINAIASIQKDYSIKTLFVWPFSKEGKLLAEKVAAAANLPLLIKKE